MTQLQPGENLGPYQIIGQVGKGGMATVHKAFHAATNRYVAIKVLPEQLTDQPQFIERFRQEAQTIANLQHPHILPVFDYGESNGKWYMVMRYLDTGTLQERMKARSLTLKEIDHFFGQLVDALGYAHSQNVVHRDLKPSNALVDSQDNLFLTDFGIAKILERQTQFTETGALMGTPDYMSPEQAQGLPVDRRSDIYSLGIILYEMVTGRVPYEAETPLAVILKHISEPLPPPTSLKPDLSSDIERVILKALAKKPEDRFAACAEFLDAWREALKIAERTPTWDTVSPPPKVETVAPTTSGKNDTWLAVGCFGALAVIACLLIVVGGWAVSSLGPSLSNALATQSANVNIPQVTRPPELDFTPEANSTEAVAPTSSVATLPPALPPTATLPAPPEAFNISNNPRESENPQVFVDENGTVHVAWSDRSLRPENDVLYRRLSEGVWSEAENLTDGLRGPVAGSLRWIRKPSNASGAPCLLWAGGLDWQMRCLSGGQWSAAEHVRTEVSWADNPNFAYAPDGSLKIAHVEFNVVMFGEAQISDGFNTVHDLKMALDADGNPHLVWIEHASSNDFILNYRYSPDGGVTWEDVQTLTDADTHANLGSAIDLAADSQGNVHFVWVSSPFISSDGATFYRKWSPDGGWGPAVELPGGRPLTELSLAADAEGLAHVVAAGLVLSQRGVMYFAQEADGSWNPAWLIATDPGDSSSSRYPNLFIGASGAPHVVWQSPDTPPDVYYASLGK
jgi:serine/threonine protein kinase